MYKGKIQVHHPLSHVGRAAKVIYKAPTDKDCPELLSKLLLAKSPTGTAGVEKRAIVPIITDFVSSVNKDLSVQIMPAGDTIIRVGNSRDHGTLFSSHMDTVHKDETPIKLLVDEDSYLWAMDQKGFPSILGADDKVGIYIMLMMIKEKVPGMYAFHTGEERGGIGSADLVKNNAGFFTNIQRCIAFDRMGTTDVIYKQGGSDCCSMDFAKSLSAMLNQAPIPAHNIFKPDPTGSFTDSANYAAIVPECTNLSVGYYNQHSTSERQDLLFLDFLVTAACNIEWSKLPTVRKAAPKVAYHKPMDASTHMWDKVGNKWVRKDDVAADLAKQNAKAGTWTGVGAVTPFTDIPEFDITNGVLYYNDASKAAITRAIEGKILQDGATKFASQIYSIMKEDQENMFDATIAEEDAKKELAGVKVELTALRDKMAAISMARKNFKNKRMVVKK